MIVTVASGKGGTGKTTIATSLAVAISDKPVTFLDCDVEAPNAHLFLNPDFSRNQEVCIMIPAVDTERCDGCGTCSQVCQFHAIVMLADRPLVIPELCHGCGSCTLNCLTDAIREVPKSIGKLECGVAINGIRFAHGVLNVGEPLAVPIIKSLKKKMSVQNNEIEIRDAPPGTSCPVVESIYGSDFVLLVTEPTPFGLHDLRLAVQLVRELNLPFGVIVNRIGTGYAPFDDYCHHDEIPVMMKIPMERRIAEVLAQGQILFNAIPEYQRSFKKLYADIQSTIKQRVMPFGEER